mgnify:CR=1 FL=1
MGAFELNEDVVVYLEVFGESWCRMEKLQQERDEFQRMVIGNQV